MSSKESPGFRFQGHYTEVGGYSSLISSPSNINLSVKMQMGLHCTCLSPGSVGGLWLCLLPVSMHVGICVSCLVLSSLRLLSSIVLRTSVSYFIQVLVNGFENIYHKRMLECGRFRGEQRKRCEKK